MGKIIQDGARIHLPGKPLEEFCRKWKVKELALFGSVLRDDFGPDSDVDILIKWVPNHGWSVLDHVAMQDELTEIFGRKVDLVSSKAVEEGRNPLRREHILGTARPIYVA